MKDFSNYKADTIGIPKFDEVRNEGRLLFEYVRGSTAYGTDIEGVSDIDTGGVYICKPEELLGYNTYKSEISDDKSDNKWYELGTFINLLVKANPNVLEALYVPENCIIGKVHPIMQYLIDNRDMFLTKKCFGSIHGFAVSQISKSRGLNKKCVNPVYERLTPLDFTYTFYKQGSEHIINFLNKHGLKPEFCGLNNIPHMNDIFGVFYDWGRHLSIYPEDIEVITKARELLNPDRIERFGSDITKEPVIHYRGLTHEEISHTTQLRLSSINDKFDKPICHISFNTAGYKDHCRKYKEYKDWEKNRNPVRYESNLNKNYDAKNMMHSFRLIHIGKEIAQGKSMIIKRTWDKEFLMNIRNHKYEYDELISLLDKEKEEMDELMKISTLPDDVDVEKLNKMLFDLRILQIKETVNI